MVKKKEKKETRGSYGPHCSQEKQYQIMNKLEQNYYYTYTLVNILIKTY